MEEVEIGSCPIYYLDDKPGVCKAQTLMVKVSGAYDKPQQIDPAAKRRELPTTARCPAVTDKVAATYPDCMRGLTRRVG